MHVTALLAMIFAGAFAYRNAALLFAQFQSGHSLETSGAFARGYVLLYLICGVPLAVINGYMLNRSKLDSVMVGGGTLVAMLVSIAFARRLNSIGYFYLFSSVTIIWFVVDVYLDVWASL